jgi:catechol 2,3-dioxygenase-like lactoylglutathione lyase family enzyme
VSLSLKHVDAITLFVDDLAAAKSFYLTVFDAPVAFEDEDSVAFHFEHTIINLLKESEAHSLIEPGVVAGREAGARLQFTVGVDDVDAVVDELERLGVTLLNGPMDREWGVRTASFADPGGHIWEVAQDLPPPGSA